jgi:hypothetical protein
MLRMGNFRFALIRLISMGNNPWTGGVSWEFVSLKTLTPEEHPLRTLKVLANFNLSSTINDELSELSSQFENLIRLRIVPIVHGFDDGANGLEESLM